MNVVYDAGVFVAAERNDRGLWADHRARLKMGIVLRTTAPVVAQVSRSPRQVQIRRMLRGCEMVGFAPDEAHDVGSLMAKAEVTDVVDAHVVSVASRHSAIVLTSDADDLRHLAAQLPTPVQVQPL
ncbi:MAG: PIN domain-containing protein [Acidimicrobiales bacterium]